MVSPTWFAELESQIFTTLQYELKTKTDAPFPTLNCTTVSQLEAPSKFPTMYVHELPAAETGQDLTNETVNALYATFEVQVYSNKSENEVKKILAAVTLEMKKLRFNVQAFPDPSTVDKISSGVARYGRIIASGDVDIVPQT